ncbi:MAG: hypothetical protein KJ592_01330 [Nanoarchaeota archaeon]|nr:hypothetical protein [Nanoarchaeota archaeon]
MRLKRDYLAVGLILVFALGLVYIFESKIGGNVVWDGGAVVNDCGGNISRLWDSVFVESSSGVEIFYNGTGTDCNSYFAIKGDAGEVYYLFGKFYENEDMNVSEVDGVYMNLTLDDYDAIMALDNYGDLYSYVSDTSGYDFILWNVVDAVGAGDIFAGIFEFVVGDFELSGSNYLYEERLGASGSDYQEVLAAGVGGDIGYVYFVDVRTVLVPSFVGFLGEIADYEFPSGGGWDTAFNWNDYFDGGGFGVEILSIGNANATYINYSVDGAGVVSFFPQDDFFGGRLFRLYVSNGTANYYSNYFNVSYYLPNDRPNLLKGFPPVVVVGDWTGFFLSGYFNDSDGDVLIYTAKSLENVSVLIVDDYVIVNFTNGYTVGKFLISASDGRASRDSNWIYVFGEDENVTYITPEYDLDLNVSSNESADDDEEKKSYALLWWILGIVLFLGILVAVVYFVFKNMKSGGVIESGRSNEKSNLLVRKYIKELGLPKKE